MQYFIDTNIFLRTLIKEDEKSFNDCYLLLEAVKENRISGTTSNTVLAEIVWTLSSYYQFPKDKVCQALRGIINLRGLKLIEQYQPLVALSLYEAKTVKYIDAVIASIPKIQNKKMVVISFDKDFDKMDVLRKEPAELKLNAKST